MPVTRESSEVTRFLRKHSPDRELARARLQDAS